MTIPPDIFYRFVEAYATSYILQKGVLRCMGQSAWSSGEARAPALPSAGARRTSRDGVVELCASVGGIREGILPGGLVLFAVASGLDVALLHDLLGHLDIRGIVLRPNDGERVFHDVCGHRPASVVVQSDEEKGELP